MAAGLQEPHRRRSSSPTSAILSALLDVFNSVPLAAASLPRNARSVGAFVDSSSEGAERTLASLQHLIPCLSNKHKLHILCGVEAIFKADVDEIIDVITRKRILKDLSTYRIVKLRIVDLQKLEGFLGWSWKDIQEKLYAIKIDVKFFLYLKGERQLMKAIEELQLARLYLLGDTGCDTVEDNPPPGCEVLKAHLAN